MAEVCSSKFSSRINFPWQTCTVKELYHFKKRKINERIYLGEIEAKNMQGRTQKI